MDLSRYDNILYNLEPYGLVTVFSCKSHLVVLLLFSIFSCYNMCFLKCNDQIEEKYLRKYTACCEKVQYDSIIAFSVSFAIPFPKIANALFFLFEWFVSFLMWEHWISVFRELLHLTVLSGLQKSNTWKVNVPELRFAVRFYSELLCNHIFWYFLWLSYEKFF